MKNYMLFAAFLFLISACNREKIEPTFQTVKNIKFAEFSKNKVTITADLVYHNPNSVGIIMDNLDLEVFVNDLKVSDISQTAKSIIASKSDFEIPLKIDYSPSGMFKNEPQKLINSVTSVALSKKAEVKIKGKTQFEVTSIKINVPVNYKEVVEIKK